MGRRLEFSDEALQSASNEQIELEQIRIFLPGFRFSSIYHAKAIISWCKSNKVGHDEIKNIDSYLIHENDVVLLKKPCAATYLLVVILTCAFLFLSLFLLHTAIKTKLSSSILSTIKANGEWVWVYKDKIEEFTLLNNPWFIYKDKITDGAEKVISADVIMILQAELNTNDLKNYVDNSIDQNMYIYLALFFLVSIYTVSLARWVLSLDRATKLHNRLSVDVGKNKSDEVVNVELVDEDILNT